MALIMDPPGLGQKRINVSLMVGQLVNPDDGRCNGHSLLVACLTDWPAQRAKAAQPPIRHNIIPDSLFKSN